MPDLMTEEERLEALWRERFGQPPPLRGCPELLERVLSEFEAKDVAGGAIE